MKERLLKLYENLIGLGIDPLMILRRFAGLRYFIENFKRYRRVQGNSRFPVLMKNLYYTSFARLEPAGSFTGHYFWQDLWAARWLYAHKVDAHVDIGSRIDGFVGHILPFCRVTYLDIRPVSEKVENLNFLKGSITAIPVKTGSVESLSCLHVIEHVGLGRYGDLVDPDGYLTAARELSRIVATGGTLLLGTPVGIECLRFDAHRIFDPNTVIRMFTDFKLVGFSLVDDAGAFIENAPLEKARACRYGCGLFTFKKE